jgi:hypothetical protein
VSGSTDNVSVSRTKTKSRLTLLLVFVLFFAPLTVAFLLYYGGAWRPADSTEHGDLIHPARSLPEIELHDADGKELAARFLRERWSLVYIGDGQCDTRCRAAFADIRRTRELLGRDSTRVQSVFLASGQCCALAVLKSIDPTITVARVDTRDASPLLAQFPEYGATPVLTAGRIYIIDPLGNLMMSYAADTSSVGMYNDLKKLLKLSHIG